jgi:hypothetical protein
LITTSYFSRAALEFAKGKPIVLIEGKHLRKWANYSPNNSKSSAPYRQLPLQQKNSSNRKVMAGLVIGVFLVFLAMYAIAPMILQSANRTQFNPMTPEHISQIEALYRGQVSSLNGIQSVESIRPVKSADGYTIFVKATVASEYQDVNLAIAMLEIAKGDLEEPIIQFVADLTSARRTVNYVWSVNTNQWSVMTRDV